MKKVTFGNIQVGDAIFVPLFNKTYRVAVKEPHDIILKRGEDDTWVVTKYYYDKNPQYFLQVEEW